MENNKRYLIRLIAFCWANQRNSLLLLSIMMFLKVVNALSIMICLQQIINNIQLHQYDITIKILILYCVLIIINRILEILDSYKKSRFKMDMEYHINCSIIEKSSRLKLCYYEDAQNNDCLERALKETQAAYYIMSEMINVITQIMSFCGSVILLLAWKWYVIFLVGIIPIISFFNTIKISKYEFYILQERAPRQRKVRYINFLLNEFRVYKENKALGINQYLYEKYKAESKTFINKDVEIMKCRLKYIILFTCLEVISGLTVIGMIIYSAIKQQILIGHINTYIQCIWNIITDIDGIVKGIANIYQKNLYLKNLFDFMDAEEEYLSLTNKHECINKITSIEFRNVSFKYKVTHKYALKNINLKIEGNEKIAIVGENGSGKSTFSKLLNGLYDDYEGTILINGISLKEIKKEIWFAKVATMFQDFTRYEFTIAENLKLANLNLTKEEIKDSVNVYKRYGIGEFIDKLKDDIDTQLGNKFKGGIELSGGQWQQIAFIRTMMKKADLYIMDEPSANLDIYTENNMFNILNTINLESISILITHRLYNIDKFAQRVLVFKEGELIEDGAVEELMEQDSYYRELYEIQCNNQEEKIC